VHGGRALAGSTLKLDRLPREQVDWDPGSAGRKRCRRSSLLRDVRLKADES